MLSASSFAVEVILSHPIIGCIWNSEETFLTCYAATASVVSGFQLTINHPRAPTLILSGVRFHLSWNYTSFYLIFPAEENSVVFCCKKSHYPITHWLPVDYKSPSPSTAMMPVLCRAQHAHFLSTELHIVLIFARLACMPSAGGCKVTASIRPQAGAGRAPSSAAKISRPSATDNLQLCISC